MVIGLKRPRYIQRMMTTLPSGESVGAIKVSYTTYTDAKEAEVNLALKGGNWYYIDDDNFVVGDAAVSVKTATITKATSAGAVYATVDGVKNVDLNAKDVVFFFLKDGAVTIASEATNVEVITANAFDALDDTLVTDFEKAETKYNEMKEQYMDGDLSKERLDYYEGLMNDAEAALEAAKEANFAKYRDGQFWGHANNAIFKHFEKQTGVFMTPNPTVDFDYMMIGDTMCVLTNSFN